MSLIFKELKCNNMVAPLGVDDLPYFSFKIESDDGDFTIKKYEIELSKKGKKIWSTGLVEKDEQLSIPYTGEPLCPETRYDWIVRITDQKNNVYESEKAFFETGRMKEFNWDAKWITSDPRGIFIGNHWEKNTTAPFIRKTFEINKEVEDATLYISGIGYYEAYVNGVSVKDSVLDPAFTEYDKTVMYLTHKITSLKQGKNALGILLGDGFYNADSEDKWNFVNADWRSHPKCICILKIDYKDGTQDRIISDNTFKGAVGPYLKNDTRTAEVYDARKELGDWQSPDYDDSKWGQAYITKAPGGALEGQYTTPMKVVDEYKPAEIIKVNDKYWIADAGFNTVGWAVISMTAPAGTEITMKFGELLNEDKTLHKGMAGCIKDCEMDLFQMEKYIAKGEGKETWHALFKYEGFRYITIACETGIPADFDLTIQEVRTDLKVAGEFECSDEMINKIQEITCRATKCNFHGMPTDCPHREKNGWTGDAQLSAEQLLLNWDGQAAYSRWLDDVIRAQRRTGQLPGIIPSTGWGFNWGSGPAWDSVCAVIPYNMYLYCGDIRIVKRMYPCIKKYLEFCDSMSTDNLCAFGLGDWCPPDVPYHKGCDLVITDTGYVYYDTLVAAKFAKILGIEDEAKFYEEKAAAIRNSFRKQFIDNSGAETDIKNTTKCQTAYAAVIYYGFCEENEKPALLKKLLYEIEIAENHLDVGILGQKYVCNVLGDNGYADFLCKIVASPEYPGLGNMVARGATTLWEDFGGTSSQNHHMFGDISGCFYKAVAGIRPTEEAPGFKKILFTPGFPETMSYAKAYHESPFGRIESGWKKNGKEIELSISVPTNTTGVITLPEGYKFADTNKSEKSVKAGKYSFKVIK